MFGNDGTNENVSLYNRIDQIITEIDGIISKTKVFIIAATNQPNIIGQTLFRPGEFFD